MRQFQYRYMLIDRQGNIQNCRTRGEAFSIAEQLGWAIVTDREAPFGRANQFHYSRGRWEAEIEK